VEKVVRDLKEIFGEASNRNGKWFWLMSERKMHTVVFYCYKKNRNVNSTVISHC
jgi:prophage antirepressor-like protein